MDGTVQVSEKARIVLFDIESTHLKANFGYCLCFGYKLLGEKKTHVLAVTDYSSHKKHPTDDAPLMRAVHTILTEQADIIVTFYGKGFDRKFLNTRMMMAGLRPLPPLNHEHIDLYYIAKYNLALHSNRLAVVAQTLGCPVEKTALSGPIWMKAMAGDRPSIQYIKDHCVRDVEVLEYVYNKLKPYIRTHPRVVQDLQGCRVCGGQRLHRRGMAIRNSKKPRARVQCQDCGAWGYKDLVQE